MMYGVLFFAQILISQVTPGDRFAWTMQGPGLPLVQSYRYEVEVDGYRLTDALKDVTCTVGAPPVMYECTAPIPLTSGQHTLRVRSVDISAFGMPAIEGAWSPAFSFFMRPVPPAPATVRVVPPTPAQPRPVKPKP